MKLSKKHLYWLLQILGWGIPFMLNAVAKLFIGIFSLSTSYILLENLTLMVTGITVSHGFRAIYSVKIKGREWDQRKVIWTAVLLVVSAVIIFIAVEILCSFWYQLLEHEDAERSITNYAITFINSFIYLLVWFMLYLLINYFIRNQQLRVERLQLENRAKESQLNTLKGQINPHFMFNSLNNIRGLMLEDVDKARDMLTQLSEMLRFSLSRKEADQVPLVEELSVVRNYIALSKIQLEERLEYQENVDEDALQVEVPPMLIQMLVENAIKHGIATLKKGGNVILNIQMDTGHLTIRVTNDGILNTATAGTQVGVSNIKQRLELLYSNEASFQLSEQAGQVHAQVKIPIQ